VDERRAFLDRVCGGDEALRREVNSYLAAHDRAGDFLDKPAFEDAAKMLAEEQAAHKPSPTDSAPQKQLHNATTIIGDHQNLPLAPGATLDGRYLIKRELGRGGIGEVFLAHDQRTGTEVVIKVLQESLLEDDDRDWFERKFRDEIKALAAINHPGVVRALDVGQLSDGRSYLVMDYVPGVPLRQVIGLKGMELERAGELLRQIAHALDAAHERGVIHRDLKPGNIMLQSQGDAEYVKIIDFGIATVRETVSATLKPTRVVGTPAYMAPEQLHGQPAPASDIYALGVIVFEMATGRQPFNADSYPQLLELQRAGVQDIRRTLCPDLPVAAEKAILKALSYKPSGRYASASDFSKAFNHALARPNRIDPFGTIPDMPPQTPVAGIRTRMRLWLLLAALLAATAIGTFAWRHFLLADDVTPGVVQTKSPAAAERSLSYSLLAVRNPERHPGGQPFVPSGEITFEAGDQAQLRLSSPQTGHLYVINEGPARTGGLPDYVVMFPNAGGSAQVAANQPIQIPSPSGKPERDWLVFDEEEGVEKIWLIWSERSVAEMEAIKRWANPKDKGVIGDSSQIKSVKQYLDAQSVAASEVEKVGANKRLEFKSRGEVLIGLVQLKHH
jgi:serine/threonine-protein kinase